MSTMLDAFLEEAQGAAIRFVGRVKDDIFTPDRFEFTSDSGSQQFDGFDQIDVKQFSTVGASGVDLASAAGLLVVSAAIQKSLSSIQSTVNRALYGIETVDRKIDQLLSVAKKIDLKISESHLREAMKHVLKKSVSDDAIDLRELAKISNDIENLIECIEGGLIGNSSIRLSSDVRAQLQHIYMVFASARIAFCTSYNRRTFDHGLPQIAFDAFDDYCLSDATYSLSNNISRINEFFRNFVQLRDNATELIGSRFSFCDDEDRSALQDLFVAFADQCPDCIGTKDQMAIYQLLPGELFSGDDTVDNIVAYLEAWLWQTDGGLIRRLQLELAIYEMGYDSLINGRFCSDSSPVSAEVVSKFSPKDVIA